MEKIDGIDGAESGNAKPDSASKKQLSQRIHWHFRFSNYENHHIDGLDALFKEICTDWIFQEEIGKEGTPHLQGAIRLKKAARYTEFSPDRKIHWEAQGSLNNSVYCCKDDETKKPGGRVCYGGSYKPKIELKLIKEEQFFPWQDELINIIKTEPDDRTVHWYWSQEGNLGKSAFAKYLVAKMGATPAVSGKYADIINLIFKQNMDNCRCIVFDIPRNHGNKVSYSAIESIKNGMIVNTKFETGFKLFNPPHIIVLCNQEPEIDKLSNDRWHIVCVD